jgi:hypothetical protein
MLAPICTVGPSRPSASPEPGRNRSGGSTGDHDQHESCKFFTLRPRNQRITQAVCVRERKSEGRSDKPSDRADRERQESEHQQAVVGFHARHGALRVIVHEKT